LGVGITCWSPRPGFGVYELKENIMKSYEKLRYIYENNLTVELLSETMTTCRLTDDAVDIKNQMVEKDFDIYGVEDEGKVIGYIHRKRITEYGTIAENYIPFSSEDLVSDSTSLIELLDVFKHKEFIFILEKNTVTKIVTVADLHKQPIRMLAFSLISILEMHLITLIKDMYPNNSWMDKLSEDRLEYAKVLLAKRLEKNEALTLLDNIQLSDKGTIVRKTPAFLEKLGLESKSKCKTFFKNVELLRNNTAHSQEEIYPDYKELIEVILQIGEVLKK
jgi:predicted transcriptional regulator